MIIEENQQLRFEWEDELRKNGHPVLSASTATQASLLLRNFPLTIKLLIHDGKEENLQSLLFSHHFINSSGMDTRSLLSAVAEIK